jgi:hypothetical protein
VKTPDLSPFGALFGKETTMHTIEERYFRTEEAARDFIAKAKADLSADFYVRLGPVLSDSVRFQDTQAFAWVVGYEEFT